MSVAAIPAEKKGAVQRLLDGIERLGNKVPHPAVMFVALCLLTVTGASLLTQKLGFSDTAGAFAAGVLLSETNFRS